jgi:HB1/ASXL restriction endonuclease-like protein with HTH domain
MKKDEVAIGRTYMAKVSDKVVPIRIESEHPRQGWFGTNQVTNKRIQIKSAQRLRNEVGRNGTAGGRPTVADSTPDVATTAPETPTEPEAVQDGQQATPAPDPIRPTPSYDERLMFAAATDPAAAREGLVNTTQGGTETDMATKNTKKAARKKEIKATTKATKAKREPKEKKVSALDAAARVLRESKEPMTTGEMIEVMAKKGYWSSPNGQTPSATLYSALLREINVKGKESRFAKTEPGKVVGKP